LPGILLLSATPDASLAILLDNSEILGIVSKSGIVSVGIGVVIGFLNQSHELSVNVMIEQRINIRIICLN
jgi:hypothetical protein